MADDFRINTKNKAKKKGMSLCQKELLVAQQLGTSKQLCKLTAATAKNVGKKHVGLCQIRAT